MSGMMNFWNGLNKLILESPLHGLFSKSTMLLTVTGRKSGKRITTPVNYIQEGSVLRVTSMADRTWWRNIEANPVVTLTLRGVQLSARGEVLHNNIEEFAAYLKGSPRLANFLHVGTNPDGTFKKDDLAALAKERVIVKFTLGKPI